MTAIRMGLTIDEFLEKHTALQLAEIKEFYRMDPWGEERADLRAAYISAALWPGKKVGDFMPYSEKQKQTADEMAAKLGLL